MKLQPDRVEKPLLKLRRQLNKFPSSPTPDDVHTLRTHTRRLEAIVAALALDREKEPRRLLKLITPVRKAAGSVRDMDVLIGHATRISGDAISEPVVRLVEHLARMRVRHARKLHSVVSDRRDDIRKGLKESVKLMRKKLKGASGDLAGEAPPKILITELSHWPELDEVNLHLFRIRIKELRYMLQLGIPADSRLVKALGEAKDTIGQWHDWVELQKIAAEVLDPGTEANELASIARIVEEKLDRALAAAKRVRARYFAVPDRRKASRKILQMAS